MRVYIITIFFLIFGLNFVNAQRFGYIDTNYILEKMPDYKKAQDEINQLSVAWEKEIADMDKKIQAMYSALQAEQVLLTDAMRKERTDEIQKKEVELKDYQKKVFGFGGLFFLKKQELTKPIQDKVWDAVDKVAKQKNLHIVFDKAGELTMIYTDPRYDYTDFILDELGLGDPNDEIKN
ncbi:OmpH family outer membrane protein [Dawidia soli]|uniref:OmpH family outer membrane protein n=1 Tax=Dawidia soli TaxID=2782352 RepID=A0AAP2D6D3_9BACT|nr:OmpH family outer membrane protein [Dawidia soli]MBT1685240.1 OmpH family outer membrane protein [Dawidia soli]